VILSCIYAQKKRCFDCHHKYLDNAKITAKMSVKIPMFQIELKKKLTDISIGMLLVDRAFDFITDELKIDINEENKLL
jgi:hypothetical protein